MGINLKVFFNFWKVFPSVCKDYRKLKKQKGKSADFIFGNSYIITNDKHTFSGTMSGHYFHQDLLVARRIYENNPKKHVDIGSRQSGFVAHVAVFREIEIFDIRPQENPVRNVVFKQADLTLLPPGMENYCDSISSLHAIEHFGLGRYNDPIDYWGHLKALDNIYKMLQIGGRFYFSTPIGRQRIEFNAHRVFNLSYLLALFKGKFVVEAFSYVDDKGNLHENVTLDEQYVMNNFNCHYGCGIFELKKI